MPRPSPAVPLLLLLLAPTPAARCARARGRAFARARAAAPLLRELRVQELPLRPPMVPVHVIEDPVGEEESMQAATNGLDVAASVAKIGADDHDSEGVHSSVVMERLKGQEDRDGGLSTLLGNMLNIIDPSGTVRRRLWTRADFMHVHAVSGAYFLFLGIPWLVYSHVVNALDTSVEMQTSSWFLSSLLVAGLVNALSAVPMSRFNSNKMFDLKDMKANGFTFGGTGLTIMCLYMAWWFSGDYPEFLRAWDVPLFCLWTLVCVGTTVNWEMMLQQNFEAKERSARKFAAVTKDEMQRKTLLYRLASWPNLTQLLFMYSIAFGGSEWLHQCQLLWPMQNTPMYHYGISSAMGYALSMFSETLRDRKLITLEQDLFILVVGFCFPMLSVFLDALTYGGAVTILPTDYWTLFGFGTGSS